MRTTQSACSLVFPERRAIGETSLMSVCNVSKEIRISYGPISDGVTGSDGGGGRLIRVGVDIFRVLVLAFSS